MNKYWQELREQAQTKIFKILFEKRRHEIVYCLGHQISAQLAQRGWGVSILGDTQNPGGHGRGQHLLEPTPPAVRVLYYIYRI